ncbi:DUF371 domain-containing protein [Salinarchaeum sp. IM2453]|uniref:DUF371 domain-containing protein n=1 Tax=Salinarchaeum sp. IM2453 TaxID=2862870 RepID=UPI001C83F0F1|nr:DUF371 domain-containing protein [Salinarchaeum sp. IM2453]QZA87708.1 DUF371 domain-containing protein [Salinarchaeum sp. IM2453]
MKQKIAATGHENVRAKHTSTAEITSDDYLTPAGDCIVGINADQTPAEFDSRFIEACKDHSAQITVTFTVDEKTATINGQGHPDLSFENDRSMVCRTSDYVDDRTIMVNADKAAADLPREMIDRLSEGGELSVEIEVE